MKIKSKVIAIPTNRIKAVEKFLGRKIALKQIPIVKIRVNADEVDDVRKIIRND